MAAAGMGMMAGTGTMAGIIKVARGKKSKMVSFFSTGKMLAWPLALR